METVARFAERQTIATPVPTAGTEAARTLAVTATYLLTEDGQHLLGEDGSVLDLTNPPNPLFRRKSPLILPAGWAYPCSLYGQATYGAGTFGGASSYGSGTYGAASTD